MERKEALFLGRELRKTLREEERLLAREEGLPAWKAELEKRVPETLRETLELAFRKAFRLVFLRGSGLIEGTVPEERLRRALGEAGSAPGPARKRLSRMKGAASRGNLGGTALAAAGGFGMGLAGLGLPDIPVLTAILLRGICRAGACYGFSWREEGERSFALRLIRAALAPAGPEREAAFLALEAPPGDPEEEMALASAALSRALLAEKFLQGIPLVGAAGAFVNGRTCRRVFRLAALRYRRRYLLGCLETGEKAIDRPPSPVL